MWAGHACGLSSVWTRPMHLETTDGAKFLTTAWTRARDWFLTSVETLMPGEFIVVVKFRINSQNEGKNKVCGQYARGCVG